MSADERYFAYGSNLHCDIWQQWCRKGTRAWLPDHELIFNRNSKGWGGGALNVQPGRGKLTPGVVFEYPPEGWAFLDAKEGAPATYERFPVMVLDDAGRTIEATSYRLRQETVAPEGFVSPASEYLEIVRAGYAEWGLDSTMLDAAASQQCPPFSIDQFFVYGTLMRGECRGGVLEAFSPRHTQRAQTTGRLMDMGEWPALSIEEPRGEVWGEVVAVDSVCEALEALDNIEGFEGYTAPGSLFLRSVVPVRMEHGETCRAWTYIHPGIGETGPVIHSGNWRAYQRGE